MAQAHILKSSRRIRPSGLVFTLIAVLTLLAAWNTGTNLLYLVVGGLFSFAILSALLVGWMLHGVRVSREAPEAVHRGEPLAVTVRIENHKHLLPAMSLRVESAARRGESVGYVASLPPRRAALVRTTEMFDKRGVYRLPPVVLVSVFPFGFIEKRRTFTDQNEVVVYPRVRAVRATVLHQLPGARMTPRRPTGDGDEFFSLREYVRGDDPRRIAWRVSARLGSLMVKELTQGASRFVVFVLDTCRKEDKGLQPLVLFDERFEEAVELVASLAVTLLNQQFSVALATPMACIPEGKGKPQVIKVLDLLARVQPTEGPRDAAVEAFASGLAAEARLVFVSPDPNQWGARSPFGGTRVLDPREVARA